MNRPDIELPYEEYMELMRIKIRVENLTRFIKEFGELVTIKEAIALLELEVEKDA